MESSSFSGGFTPDYVYRLLAEMYHPDDYHMTTNNKAAMPAV
jgi:hypothetical protein